MTKTTTQLDLFQTSEPTVLDYSYRFSLSFAQGSIADVLWDYKGDVSEEYSSGKLSTAIQLAEHYFKFAAKKLFEESRLQTWQECKEQIAKPLKFVFGPPEVNRFSGEVDWTKGGANKLVALTVIDYFVKNLLSD